MSQVWRLNTDSYNIIWWSLQNKLQKYRDCSFSYKFRGLEKKIIPSGYSNCIFFYFLEYYAYNIILDVIFGFPDNTLWAHHWTGLKIFHIIQQQSHFQVCEIRYTLLTLLFVKRVKVISWAWGWVWPFNHSSLMF